MQTHDVYIPGHANKFPGATLESHLIGLPQGVEFLSRASFLVVASKLCYARFLFLISSYLIMIAK